MGRGSTEEKDCHVLIMFEAGKWVHQVQYTPTCMSENVQNNKLNGRGKKEKKKAGVQSWWPTRGPEAAFGLGGKPGSLRGCRPGLDEARLAFPDNLITKPGPAWGAPEGLAQQVLSKIEQKKGRNRNTGLTSHPEGQDS